MDKDKLGNVLWTPNDISGSNIREFCKYISEKYNVKIENFRDLHRWSVQHRADFWAEIWDRSGTVFSKPYDQVVDLNKSIQEAPEWYKGAKLNFAENILKYRDDRVALIIAGEARDTERVTYAQIYEEACLYGAALRSLGVEKNDRVVCYMSNRKEPVLAMLGTTSIGAIWSGALPLMGSKAVAGRFRQIKPKVLFTVDRFVYEGEERDMLDRVEMIAEELPSLQKVVIVPSREESKKKDISRIKNGCFLDDFLLLGRRSDGSVPPLEFEQLPFDHPTSILYTSGTTGDPKGLVHGMSNLLTTYRDFILNHDGNRDMVWLSMSPVGWASWNIFTSVLSQGMSVVLYEGVPFFLTPTYIWDLTDELNINCMFIPPSILDALEKRNYLPTEKHHLSSLKIIVSGGSVVRGSNFDFVYKKIKPGIFFGAGYGCSEVSGFCTTSEMTLPIIREEITSAALGVDIQIYSDSGQSVVGEAGELGIGQTSPTLKFSLWGDKDGSVFRKSYFKIDPNIFTPGDIGLINPATRGLVCLGRSDDTLKPGGWRFGSSEIYNVVNLFHEVEDSICVSQYNKTGVERAVLFVKMKKGNPFKQELVQRVRNTISSELSPNHVPSVIVETKEIPHNINGKKMEITVKKIINNMPYNPETVVNQECLKNFENVPELQGF